MNKPRKYIEPTEHRAGGFIPVEAAQDSPEGLRIQTECCKREIEGDQRYCPRCGWECRIEYKKPQIRTVACADGTVLAYCSAAETVAFVEYALRRATEAEERVRDLDEFWDCALSDSVGIRYNYETKVVTNPRAESAESKVAELQKQLDAREAK